MTNMFRLSKIQAKESSAWEDLKKMLSNSKLDVCWVQISDFVYNQKKGIGKPFERGQLLFVWMSGPPPLKPSSPASASFLCNVY